MNNIILPKDHLSLTSSKDIFEISQILKPYGIENFAYCRYFLDHTAYVFNSHAQSHEHHLKQGYIFCPQIPKDIKTNKFYCLPGIESSYEYIQAMYDHQNYFNLGNFFCMFEKYADHFDAYLFSAKPNNHAMINFYLNNLDFLENFKFYFKEKAKKLIIKLEKNKLLVPEPMRPLINRWKPAAVNNKHVLLTAIEPKQYFLNNHGIDTKITRNELAVIRHWALGNTIKEIAKIIEISPRTVETYLNNVRQKMLLEKKTDITRVLLENNLL